MKTIDTIRKSTRSTSALQTLRLLRREEVVRPDVVLDYDADGRHRSHRALLDASKHV